MTTAVQTGWLSQALRYLPSSLLAALDAWSYRVALRRAERRRLAQSARQRKAAAIVAQYRVSVQ